MQGQCAFAARHGEIVRNNLMTMNFPSLPWLDYRFATKVRWLLLSILLPAMGTTSMADAQELDELRCGPLRPPGQYGPYDYRTATVEQKSLVEGAHFSKQNELLIKGTSQERPGPDIDYTLRAFPNHPRALKSVMDLAFREKTNKPFGTRYITECWFNRALRFTPDDPQVHLIYGIFLLKSGKNKEAVEQLETARSLGLDSANFQYNLGLVYFQAHEYDKARAQAYKAKELGYELEGLKNLLTRAGQWREKAADGTSPKATASPAAKSPAPKN
jgi:tetratricopeptide (TPR) repeat protein